MPDGRPGIPSANHLTAHRSTVCEKSLRALPKTATESNRSIISLWGGRRIWRSLNALAPHQIEVRAFTESSLAVKWLGNRVFITVKIYNSTLQFVDAGRVFR